VGVEGFFFSRVCVWLARWRLADRAARQTLQGPATRTLVQEPAATVVALPLETSAAVVARAAASSGESYAADDPKGPPKEFSRAYAFGLAC
jgi:hypothetical protein